MEIRTLNELTADEKAAVLAQMEKCDWDAGQYLCDVIREDSLEEQFGEDPVVLLLFEEDKLASFCTYVEFDEIESEDMKPWIGFVYTFPAFRGKRFSGALVEYAVGLARKDGYKKIYVSSEEIGLYEKYGFSRIGEARSVHDYDTGIFVREI